MDHGVWLCVLAVVVLGAPAEEVTEVPPCVSVRGCRGCGHGFLQAPCGVHVRVAACFGIVVDRLPHAL